ncbi:MAG: hypothetical protein M0Z54_14550 [Thermaerobacter sp.]|nr:hypothetical protein [Thermaerobacter sp.]
MTAQRTDPSVTPLTWALVSIRVVDRGSPTTMDTSPVDSEAGE